MAPRCWASADQLEYLNSEVGAFIEARKSVKKSEALRNFRNRVFENFFTQWPVVRHPNQDFSISLASQKQKIYRWFYWHTRTTKTNQHYTLGKKLVDTVRHKRRHPVQPILFYHRRNKDQLRPLIDKSIQEQGATSASDRMKIRRQVVKESWENEDDDVIAAIEEACRDHNRDYLSPPTEDHHDTIEPNARSPLEYKNSLASLPPLLSSIFEALAVETGWVFFISTAGPHPEANGNIYLQNYYFGPRNAAGKDFKSAYPNFVDHFQVPFSDHVSDCFPQSIRSLRSLRSGPMLYGRGTTKSSTSIPSRKRRLQWDQIYTDSDDSGDEQEEKPSDDEESPTKNTAPGSDASLSHSRNNVRRRRRWNQIFTDSDSEDTSDDDPEESTSLVIDDSLENGASNTNLLQLDGSPAASTFDFDSDPFELAGGADDEMSIEEEITPASDDDDFAPVDSSPLGVRPGESDKENDPAGDPIPTDECTIQVQEGRNVGMDSTVRGGLSEAREGTQNVRFPITPAPATPSRSIATSQPVEHSIPDAGTPRLPSEDYLHRMASMDLNYVAPGALTISPLTSSSSHTRPRLYDKSVLSRPQDSPSKKKKSQSSVRFKEAIRRRHSSSGGHRVQSQAVPGSPPARSTPISAVNGEIASRRSGRAPKWAVDANGDFLYKPRKSRR